MKSVAAEALAGRLLMIGFHGVDAPDELLQLAAGDGLGGIILFARNIASAQQVTTLIQSFRAQHPESEQRLLVAIDQEGGRVARIREPYVLQLPAMREFALTHDRDEIENAFYEVARDLKRLGFNVDFAPVLDVDTNPNNPVIGDRAFGRTPEEVIAGAMACAVGLLRGGVLPCGKHFPGHGDTDLDSHFALPHVAHDWDRIETVELAPFAAFARADMPMLMTAHVHFDALDPGVPATLSKKWLHNVLRQQLGFAGVVVSDDLEMKAVSELAPVDELAVSMIDAGCDLLLICSDVSRALQARDALASRIVSDADFAARARASDARRLAMFARMNADSANI